MGSSCPPALLPILAPLASSSKTAITVATCFVKVSEPPLEMKGFFGLLNVYQMIVKSRPCFST